MTDIEKHSQLSEGDLSSDECSCCRHECCTPSVANTIPPSDIVNHVSIATVRSEIKTDSAPVVHHQRSVSVMQSQHEHHHDSPCCNKNPEHYPRKAQEEAKVVDHLTQECLQVLKQIAKNLRTHAEFRQARLEMRVERGEVCGNELGLAPLVNDWCGFGPGINYWNCSSVGGHHDDWEVRKCFELLPLSDGKIPNPLDIGNSFGEFAFPGKIFQITAVPYRFLNLKYTLRRLARAGMFVKSKSFREIMGRIHLMWDRRRGRCFPREDPPKETPWAPTIARPTAFLNDNGDYHCPEYSHGWLVKLYPVEEGESHFGLSGWGQKHKDVREQELKEANMYKVSE